MIMPGALYAQIGHLSPSAPALVDLWLERADGTTLEEFAEHWNVSADALRCVDGS